MIILNTNGLSCRGTTAIKLKTAHVPWQEHWDIVIQAKWNEAMFKLRRRNKAPAFPPRPIKSWKGKNGLFEQFAFKPEEPIKYKSPFECGHAFGNYLEKKGFTRLGLGTFSTVFCKGDSQRVIKVCHRLDAWMDYISWSAKKGYCGTYAPRVYSYKYFKGVTSPFYVAVVERLEKTVGDVKDDHPMAFTYTAMKWNLQRDVANDNALQILDLLSPGLMQFTTDFNAFAKTKATDLHTGNFMLRKDGSFVATDPIMGHQKETSTHRLRSKDFTGLTTAPLERLAA